MPEWREEDSKRNNAYSVYGLLVFGHALAQESLPWGHEIYNFNRPFLGYYIYILSLSVLCLRVEKKNFKEIMHFTLWLIWPHPCTSTPAPGIMIYTVLVDPSLVIITCILHLGCIDHSPRERRCFNQCSNFTVLSPQITSPWVGGHKFSCLYTLLIIHIKFG